MFSYLLAFIWTLNGLGGRGGVKITPLVISRRKQVRNMTFCMGLPCLKKFLPPPPKPKSV